METEWFILFFLLVCFELKTKGIRGKIIYTFAFPGCPNSAFAPSLRYVFFFIRFFFHYSAYTPRNDENSRKSHSTQIILLGEDKIKSVNPLKKKYYVPCNILQMQDFFHSDSRALLLGFKFKCDCAREKRR